MWETKKKPLIYVEMVSKAKVVSLPDVFVQFCSWIYLRAPYFIIFFSEQHHELIADCQDDSRFVSNISVVWMVIWPDFVC